MNECAIKNKKELERIMSKVNKRAQTIVDKDGVIFEHEIDRIVREEFRIGPGSLYDEFFGERR